LEEESSSSASKICNKSEISFKKKLSNSQSDENLKNWLDGHNRPSYSGMTSETYLSKSTSGVNPHKASLSHYN